jgi:4'-phosphopantetheinyl transferase
LNVSALCFDTPIGDRAFDALLESVPPARRESALKYLRRVDRERALLGEALVRYLLASAHGLADSGIVFSKNSFGKPMLPDDKAHFNITHSGKWVACVTDREPVGIDVEKIKQIDSDIAKRFFSKVEYSDLLAKGEERLGYFYDLWTLKESFIKAVGKGLSLPLSSFSIRIDGSGEISIDPGDHPGVYHFKQYPIDPEYRFSVCAQNRSFPETVRIYTVEELLRAIAG